MQNANKKINSSKPEILRLLWNIVVFRLVAYLLNMICLLFKPTISIQIVNIWIFYKFDTVLYQFLETRTSDIIFLGRNQELMWLAFSLYPLSFFLYSPFKPIRFNCNLFRVLYLDRWQSTVLRFWRYFQKSQMSKFYFFPQLLHLLCRFCWIYLE